MSIYKPTFIIKYLSIYILLLFFSFDAISNTKWEEIAEDDGIKTWKKDIPSSSLFAFKAKARIKGSFARLITAFMEIKYHKDWVDMYNGAELVDNLDAHNRHLYHRIILPSPIHLVVDERDFVLSMSISVDQEKREFRGEMKSITVKGRSEKSCCVRAKIEYGSFLFRSLAKSGEIDIEVEAHIDPKGTVPGWIVYYVQKHWASDTIKGLRKVSQNINIPKESKFLSWEEPSP